MGDPGSVIIDCDPGIDDALAILLAIASPELKVEAITTVCGNVSVFQTTENALKILELCRVKSPPSVYMGSSAPLSLASLELRKVHGEDGLGMSELPAPRMKPADGNGIDFVISKARTGSERLSVISLGPLTNVAYTLKRAPTIAKLIELFVMGGALHSSDGICGAAEFNVRSDPEAFKAILGSGVPITMVSMDVTRKVILTSVHLSRLRDNRSKLARFIVRICDYSIDFHRRESDINGMYLNDPLAVGIAIDESLGEFEDLCIDVDLERFRGRTKVVVGPPNVGFCKDVDSDRFLDLFLNRLEALCLKK